MDQEKYKQLVNLANETIYQIYTLKAEFNDKTYVDLSDNNYKISVQVRESDSTIPTANTKVIIPVSNGQATLPEFEYPKNIHLELVGTQHTFKEEFEIFSNAIAHAYDKVNLKGRFIIYKSDDIDNVKAQSRFRMMVNSTHDEVIGWIEIAQEDKNDKDSIIYKIKTFYDKIKAAIQIVIPELKLVTETISTFAGIMNDLEKKLSFSYLKLSPFNLLIAISVLLI